MTGTGNHKPSVALALGGGGARGLAHIGILEVLDEMGLRPKAIAGTSIGAIFGAAYASGMSGAEIRAHTVEILTRRFSLIRDLIASPALSAETAKNLFLVRGSLIEPEALLDLVFPGQVAASFEDLKIPLQVVASDYYALDAKTLSSGALRPAVAASMALPVIFKPVRIGDRLFMDGGFTNPLPFDLLDGAADILIAVDVSGVVREDPTDEIPAAFDMLFSLSFFFQRALISEKMKTLQPDVFVEAGTGTFNVLDFMKVSDILEAAEPAKQRFKTQLQRVLAAAPAIEADADQDGA